MKKLIIYVAVIIMNAGFLSCRKDVQVEPITAVETASIDWNGLVKRVNNETLTTADRAYLDEKMRSNTRGATTDRCGIQAPYQWGQGGSLVFLQSQFEITANSIYSYFPQPMVQIPAIGIFQVTYRKNNLWKTATKLKLIQPGTDLYDFGTISITNLLIDYNTNFYMESWGISICGNVSHIKETFGPYNNSNALVIDNAPVQFGKNMKSGY